nr:phospholipase A2 inhibitor and Ly6/PLAUR domain-containing protein-like isoform X2 [Pogona vitticeps]
MQALLRLFLSFLLPTIGASIQCEVCYSVGNSCTGNMQTCPSGQDICTVAFSESTLVPPEQVRPNGLQCPACYSWTQICSSEMVNCTGSDTYCFGVLSRIYTNEFHVDSIIKGCTTKSVCKSLLHGKSPFFGRANTVISAKCSPDVSRGCRITISLLPSFSGLLLLQVLL